MDTTMLLERAVVRSLKCWCRELMSNGMSVGGLLSEHQQAATWGMRASAAPDKINQPSSLTSVVSAVCALCLCHSARLRRIVSLALHKPTCFTHDVGQSGSQVMHCSGLRHMKKCNSPLNPAICHEPSYKQCKLAINSSFA